MNVHPKFGTIKNQANLSSSAQCEKSTTVFLLKRKKFKKIMKKKFIDKMKEKQVPLEVLYIFFFFILIKFSYFINIAAVSFFHLNPISTLTYIEHHFHYNLHKIIFTSSQKFK